MIRIYGSDGRLKIEAPCDDNSTQEHELQGDNVLALSFTLWEHVALEVNDWAEFMGRRYWLMERYRPEQKSTVEWKYDVRLYGVESLIKRFLVLNDTDGADEAVFTLTAPAREHVALIVRSINNGMGTTDWKAGTVEGTDNIVIDYEGKYCDEALREVAEKAGNKAEWWVEGQTVNVCRCETGEEVALGYGKGLTGLSCDMADNADFYTRLYPIGSSRNIDPEKYGHTRLQLPGGVKHVDVNVEQYGVWDRYEAEAFAGIYPKWTGEVASVRYSPLDADGKRKPRYIIKAVRMDFDPNDYLIGGGVMRVTFETGDLAGLGEEEDGTGYFEAYYDSGSGEIELVTIWPYDDDTALPNESLRPKAGDRFMLWNISMPDEYYPLAEQELKEAVDRYNEENAVDAGRYKGATDHVYIEENGIGLYVGRRVRLESRQYFPETGYRSSRITKITRRVNLPSQADVEISDAVSTGAMERIDNSIGEVKSYVKTATGGGFPDLIRSWENTLPTDNNVFSARRSQKEFVSRLADDTASGNLTFEKMLTVLGLSIFKSGAQFGEFVKSLYAGKGAGIDELGNAEFESVRVRSYFECLELIVNRLSAIEGDQLLTEADTIESVDDLGDGCYGLHLKSKWEGYFTAQAANNVLKGIINTLAAGSGTYYTSWMRVNSVNTANNYIEVTLYPDEETPAGTNYPPCEMMRIARWGNQTDTRRQSCIYLSSTEGRIVRLTGVTKPIVENNNYGATLGELPEFLRELDLPIAEGQDYLYARGIVVRDIVRVDYQGRPVSEIVDRGPWSATEKYYCEALNPDTGNYEISDVWYNGCKYRCAKTGTRTAPAWNNTDWAMVEGNPEFTVDFEDTDYLFDPDKFNLTLAIVARLHNMDVTDDILDADVQWTRYSEDDKGVERVASDNVWALKRAGAGKKIDLTADDCDFNGYVPRALRFTATVTLRDGMGGEAAEASAVFEY